LKEFSFSKQDRLTRRSQFVQLSVTGKRIVGRYFLAIIASGKTARTRLGVTVTRKVGPAYQRNRIKRLVREHFRQHRDEISGTWDINIIAKQGAGRVANPALQRSLADLFAEIDIKLNRHA
jgi:ribonuclease P protein component